MIMLAYNELCTRTHLDNNWLVYFFDAESNFCSELIRCTISSTNKNTYNQRIKIKLTKNTHHNWRCKACSTKREISSRADLCEELL